MPDLIDAQWNLKHDACYLEAKLLDLYDRPMTLIEVLTRTDNMWSEVPTIDRLWVAENYLSHKQLLPVYDKWINTLMKKAESTACHLLIVCKNYFVTENKEKYTKACKKLNFRLLCNMRAEYGTVNEAEHALYFIFLHNLFNNEEINLRQMVSTCKSAMGGKAWKPLDDLVTYLREQENVN